MTKKRVCAGVLFFATVLVTGSMADPKQTKDLLLAALPLVTAALTLFAAKKQGRHGAWIAACGAPQSLGVGCQHRPDGSEREWAERELLAADAAADRVAGDAGADRILGAVGGIGSGR